LNVLDFALGFQAALDLSVPYFIWRYVYAPWKVMRKDIAALAVIDTQLKQRIEEFENALRPSRISAMSDEQVASIENRLRLARKNVS
jgi:hypothetical protein